MFRRYSLLVFILAVGRCCININPELLKFSVPIVNRAFDCGSGKVQSQEARHNHASKISWQEGFMGTSMTVHN